MNTAVQMQEITPDELYECHRVGKRVDLIDVSTPIEFATRRVSFAMNFPIDSPELDAFMNARGEDCTRHLYVMCAGGVRSVKVCSRHPKANLVNVEGGMRNWVFSGLPVASTEGVVSMDRQVRIVTGTCALVGSVLAVIAHPFFAVVPGLFGLGLLVAGLTDTCGVAMMLAKMPWNRAGGQAKARTTELYSH